jgi:hypothetical protein
MDWIVRQRRSESAWREIVARQEQSGRAGRSHSESSAVITDVEKIRLQK